MKVSKQKGIRTNSQVTWCPGCPNHMILESVKRTVEKLINSGQYKQTDFAITTDVGCQAKIFDYLNLSGIYCLHGRSISTGVGIKIGNPNLKVLSFSGDGGAYAEGISHFVHSFRYNADMTIILHDNQSFSLTTGQPSPTSQTGYKSKAKPQGEENNPLNPLMLAISSGATFIARANARDINHTCEVLEKAIAHKGLAFVEIIQDCLIFNLDANSKDERMYKIEDNFDKKRAIELAMEYDYNTKDGKIPMGIIYQNTEPRNLTEKWMQLTKLEQQKTCWAEKR